MSSMDTDGVVRIVAMIAAGVFFAWKLLTGWLFINLRVELKLERIQKDDAFDHFAIALLLEKGPTDSVWLKHIEARITSPMDPKEQQIDMTSETRRLHVHAKKLVWDQTESAGRSIVGKRQDLTPMGDPNTRPDPQWNF